MKERIYFLDHLRTFAIFLVVVLHAGLVYEQVLENNWIVIDPDKNNSIGLIRMYLDVFVMYTIFFISGYFVPLSLKKKSTIDFLKAKVKRILWPWIIAVFTLIPAYKILFLYSRGLPQEAWYTYFHIFQRTGTDHTFFSNDPNQNWLWFLPILFVFQILYLALSKMNVFPLKISLKTGVVLTIVLGVIYSMIISNTGLTGWYHSGFFEFQRERLLPYFLVFLLGALGQELHVFESKKNTKHYIIANVVLTISLGVFTALALNLFFNLIEPGRNFYFISSLIDRTGYYFFALLSMFSLLYVLIHAFRFNLNKTNSLMNQLNKNSYAVYIIHMVVLGGFALLLVPLSLPVMLKYLLLTVLTFAGSNLLVTAYNEVVKEKVVLRLAAAAVFIACFFVITNNESVDKIDVISEKTVKTSNNEMTTPETGLHEAVIKGDIAAIRQHIQAGSDLDEVEPQRGSSPLITAAVFGKTEIALLLIESGADINFQNKDGSTPLHTAAFFCRLAIVEALLENGANRKIKNKAGSIPIDGVQAPFEVVKGFYDYYQQSLASLGLELDYEQIKKDRPKVVELLKE